MISSDQMAEQKLARAVREAFRRSGLSIKQLSERSKVPYAGAHSFVNGNPDVRLSTLSRLAEGLGLELVARPKRKR